MYSAGLVSKGYILLLTVLWLMAWRLSISKNFSFPSMPVKNDINRQQMLFKVGNGCISSAISVCGGVLRVVQSLWLTRLVEPLWLGPL